MPPSPLASSRFIPSNGQLQVEESSMFFVAQRQFQRSTIDRRKSSQYDYDEDCFSTGSSVRAYNDFRSFGLSANPTLSSTASVGTVKISNSNKNNGSSRHGNNREFRCSSYDIEERKDSPEIAQAPKKKVIAMRRASALLNGLTRYRRMSKNKDSSSDDDAVNAKLLGDDDSAIIANKNQNLATMNWIQRPRLASTDQAGINSSKSTWPPAELESMSTRQLHQLAGTCLKCNEPNRALDIFERILLRQMEKHDYEHPNVAATHHNIGVAHIKAGRHDMAQENLLKAVSIRKNVLPPDHDDIAASLIKLGGSYAQSGKYDEALVCQREVLQVRKSRFGPQHTSIAEALSYIACTYFQAGELLSSQAMFEDALEMYQSFRVGEIGRDKVDCAIGEILCNIGSVQLKKMQFSLAISSFEKALKIQCDNSGEDDLAALATMDSLAFAYTKIKEYEMALKTYQQMLNIQQFNQDCQNDDCARTLRKISIVQEKQCDYASAFKSLKSALSLRETYMSESDSTIQNTRRSLYRIEGMLQQPHSPRLSCKMHC